MLPWLHPQLQPDAGRVRVVEGDGQIAVIPTGPLAALIAFGGGRGDLTSRLG